jgi:hypothetical protein
MRISWRGPGWSLVTGPWLADIDHDDTGIDSDIHIEHKRRSARTRWFETGPKSLLRVPTQNQLQSVTGVSEANGKTAAFDTEAPYAR